MIIGAHSTKITGFATKITYKSRCACMRDAAAFVLYCLHFAAHSAQRGSDFISFSTCEQSGTHQNGQSSGSDAAIFAGSPDLHFTSDTRGAVK